MKHEFKVKLEVNWNASHVEEVIVRTNNEKNAKKLAIKKLAKKYDANMMTILSVAKIN